MNTITLSGWGQPYDALSVIAPDAVAIDYVHAANVDEVFRMLTPHADAKRVIGWSLGGQLALRAVSEGILQPEQLVLIAAPYRFVGKHGMGSEDYYKFESNYARNPSRTLDKAWELIHYNDTRSGYIKEQISCFDKEAVLKQNWLRWLRILAEFNNDNLHLTRMPPTLLVHGKKDVVVNVRQSEMWEANIPNARRVLWEGCGHAPHFHDAKRLQTLIHEHANV